MTIPDIKIFNLANQVKHTHTSTMGKSEELWIYIHYTERYFYFDHKTF